jgi:cytochrome oxidase Cu insertion factor (SCO1/SenC/PrrC family)
MFLPNRRSPAARLTLVTAAIGLFLLGYYWGNRYQYGSRGPAPIDGILVTPPLLLPEFTLQDQHLQPFTPDNLSGHWSLFAVGALPRAEGQRAVARLIQVYNRIADQPELQRELILVLVATAGERRETQDFARLSPALKLLSGEAVELARLEEFFGYDPTDADTRGTVYLVDPKGRMLALFARDQQPDSVAQDIKTISDHPLDFADSSHD